MSKSELLELLQTERLHVRALERKHAELDQERARLERENKLLRQKIDALSRAMFGRKSEQLSQEQLELVFAELGLTPPERNSKTITVTRRVAALNYRFPCCASGCGGRPTGWSRFTSGCEWIW